MDKFEKQYFNFRDAIDSLISISIENRKSIENLDQLNDSIYPSIFAREFKTVHCNIGRRTGKSRYIAERASPSDIIICHNEIIKRELYSNSKAQVITAGFLRDKLLSKTWIPNRKDIYVDEPFLCIGVLSPYSINEWLYDMFNDKNDNLQTFILLGFWYV